MITASGGFALNGEPFAGGDCGRRRPVGVVVQVGRSRQDVALHIAVLERPRIASSRHQLRHQARHTVAAEAHLRRDVTNVQLAVAADRPCSRPTRASLRCAELDRARPKMLSTWVWTLVQAVVSRPLRPVGSSVRPSSAATLPRAFMISSQASVTKSPPMPLASRSAMEKVLSPSSSPRHRRWPIGYERPPGGRARESEESECCFSDRMRI